MTFLIQQTLIYAVPLMIVALAGVFAERSGIINLALEGIMVFGAFIGVWFVRILQTSDAILSLKQSGNWVALQGVELLTMLVAAAFGPHWCCSSSASSPTRIRCRCSRATRRAGS